MKRIKKISVAEPDQVGPINIYRALPNREIDLVGPIIFLDHIPDKYLAAGEFPIPDGSFAHPHRGIATFTYLVKGEIMHFDSHGGHGLVQSGGVQWMNAGNGVIHDEIMPRKRRESGGEFYAFQFWVNLPAKNKAEAPDYMPVQSNELPSIPLGVEAGAGTLKVLLGEYNGQSSPIPTFSEQLIWHICLKVGQSVELPTKAGLEYGGYVPEAHAVINDVNIKEREFFLFEKAKSGIRLENPGASNLDILIFGGEAYQETMVAHGPFVMNSQREIYQAYDDYQSGKYGKINYQGYLA